MPFLSNTPRLWLFVMGILVGYILVRVKYRNEEVAVNEASNPFKDLQMCEERMEDINTTIEEGQATCESYILNKKWHLCSHYSFPLTSTVDNLHAYIFHSFSFLF